jgi:hypothetical protein
MVYRTNRQLTVFLDEWVCGTATDMSTRITPLFLAENELSECDAPQKSGSDFVTPVEVALQLCVIVLLI